MKRFLREVCLMLAGISALLGLAGCGSGAGTKASYDRISQEEAKEIMDSGENYILLDVRTPEEFRTGHIAGALLIPDYDIAEKAPAALPDKEALILVYCRSGNRSRRASAVLAELGYTQVKEFGGINTWPYGTVTS